MRVVFFEKGNIFRGVVVGVICGYIGVVVSDFVGNGSECILNGWVMVIFVDGVFNLVIVVNC